MRIIARRQINPAKVYPFVDKDGSGGIEMSDWQLIIAADEIRPLLDALYTLDELYGARSMQ